ncbi:DUF2206 domain-containing protein [Methanosarcina mazei]|jgi:uncharacterized membrane protein|nr:DUF2206 domain-containing protein [Methanosarcina mazei]
MYIKNPLNFVEWNIKSFLLVLFSIHIAMLGVIGLDVINFEIPIIRQVIGFIYLTFVPGVLFLRLLRLKQISFLEKSMFTVALSLITLMLSGFFLNELGAVFIKRPISTIPLFCMIFLIVSILFIVCYIREKNDVHNPSFVTFNYSMLPSIIYLVIVLFSVIFGTYLVNYYHSNILLLFAILLIDSIIFLIFFEKLIPELMYPMIIFVLSISLLYHNSLISSTLYGFDIHQEYYASNLVMMSGVWDHDIPRNINAMLSIVVLAPIYSNICDLSLTYVFKIVYPFLFSFTPLGIYLIYKKQINNSKVAFFSVFYFMSVYPYYTEMLALARQEIAEIFLVLIVLVMISNYEAPKKKLLYTIFSVGLVISHYGLSYLFIFLSLIGYIFLVYSNKKSEIFNPRTIFLFIICAIGWHIYISSGSIFDTVLNLLENVYHSIAYEIFQTSTVSLATKSTPSLCGKLLRMVYFSSQFFILVGFVHSMFVYKNSKTKSGVKFSKEYMALSLACACSLIVFLVTSSTGMNIYRFFHISTIFLSLFCILGGLVVFKFADRAMQHIVPDSHNIIGLKFLSVFLALFLLLNIGFVQEITKDNPTSVSLSLDSMKEGGVNSSMLLYRYYIPIQDVHGSVWLSQNRNNTMNIYADETAVTFVLAGYGMMPDQKCLYDERNRCVNSYIYFRYPNIIYGVLSKRDSDMYGHENISELLPIINQKHIIYSNGYNAIYT